MIQRVAARIRLNTVSRRNLAVDVGLAGLVLAVTFAMVASDGYDQPDVRSLDWLGALLVAASALVLAGRRLAPLAVHATTSAATLALVGLGYALDFPFGPLVGMFTLGVSHGGDLRQRRQIVALLVTVGFLGAAGAISVTREHDAIEVGPRMTIWALSFVGAWIAGDRTRLRREQFTQLAERAARIEREAERERRLAAAEERTRIARELHDSAAHAINVILVQASAARLLHERNPYGSREAIATIEEVARRTIGEIDQLVRALRENDNSSALLPANPIALEELIERHRDAGLRVTVETSGSRDALPRGVAWATYRILHEALTNAARHGRGSADVVLRFEPGTVDATVTNPTAPLDSTASGGGHGIVGMRERATLLGGVLDTATDNGIFRLHARLPYQQEES